MLYEVITTAVGLCLLPHLANKLAKCEYDIRLRLHIGAVRVAGIKVHVVYQLC